MKYSTESTEPAPVEVRPVSNIASAGAKVLRSTGVIVQTHDHSARIAFLVAAHSEPVLLARLVRALAAPWAHVFIHIDAKTDIGAFLQELSDIPDVTFISDRVRVYWGGWSQVEASLRLMRAARDHHPSFARFALLSGACYPLRGSVALRDFLLADNTEHIAVARLDREKPLKRLTRWHFEGGNRTSGSKAAFIRLLNTVTLCGPPRNAWKALDGFAPHSGSNWWTLTREAVEIIMHTTQTRPELVEFYRHSAFPDESFFQTVLANSLPPARIGSTLTFADWSPGRERPHPISERHLARLLDPAQAQGGDNQPAGYFFARKFGARNAHLLDIIDAARRGTAASGERSDATA